MSDKPLAVVIAALICDGHILLQKRKRGDYVGLWGLPGGKIERGEHLSAAAQREILAETGINASFKSHLGFVSEILQEQGEVANHFLLHLCELQCDSMKVTSNDEGDTAWFILSKLQELQEELIPGDYI